jgi:pheromone shutdown protein TraB
LVNTAHDVYTTAARAEAAHRHEKAKAMLRIKADVDFKMSIAEAETRADADDTVAELFQQRVVTAAAADALRAKLAQLREQVAVGRTAVVDERAGDQFHSRGYGGTA